MILTSSDGAISNLDRPNYRQVRLWTITRLDGWVRRFTDHNKRIEFYGNTFKPLDGMNASASRRETAFKGQNFEALGIISDSEITVEDLAGDLFLGARIQEWIIDWKYPHMGYFLYSTFLIKDHEFDNLGWKAQVEGPMSVMETTVGDTYTPACRHTYGKPGCNRVLDDAAASLVSITYYNSAGVAQGVTSVHGHPQLILNELNQPMGATPYKNRWMKILGVRVATPPSGQSNTNRSFYLNTSDIAADYSEPDPVALSAGTVDFWDLQRVNGWFSNGRLKFTTGSLASRAEYDISKYEHPYGSAHILVYTRLPMPFVPQVGDLVTLTAGCDHSWNHCRGKNANMDFFGGFIFIPGPDKIYQRPGSI